MDLSIILINFNTPRLTEDCVRSILATAQLSYEIIVVDNSTDERQRYIPPADEAHIRRIIVENHGFGHACNAGMAIANGRNLLLLNNDTIVHEHTLEDSVAYMDAEPDIGALGVKSLLKDGTLDHGCKRGFPTPWASLSYMLGLDRLFPHTPLFGQYRLSYLPDNEIQDVDVVSGAYMLLRRKVWEQTGGFDETFFMYGEDIDLCYRIKERGWRVVYYPPVSILHLRGQSGLSSGNPFVIRQFYQSMLIFYDKHYREKYPALLTWLVRSAVKAKQWLALRRAQSGRAQP